MQSPQSPIAFSIGQFDVHFYGIIMFFAILFGIGAMFAIAKRYYREVDTEKILDILPVIIISAILGARIYYVLMDIQYYAKHLNEIFAVWRGGLSIHGALIGGITAGIILTKKHKLKFLKYADVFAYGLLIGQATGRFGNYFNCEAFGLPTNLPFGLFIPTVYRPYEYLHFEYFHPTFLYESIWNILVFFILLFGIRKIPKIADGTVFFSYLILYSAGRFFIEFLRIDSVLDVFGVPVAQLVSGFAIILGILFLIMINYHNKNKNHV